jgi:predicted 3-demethylubiquinone-9 3-methyltransferase (glyoxalase superfamily)
LIESYKEVCVAKDITPNLWFAGNAQEAVDFYVSIFPGSRVIASSNYPDSTAEGLADFQLDLAGKILTIDFELSGNRFLAINADSTFQFTEAVSFAVSCDDQAEIDYFWDRLSAVPESEQCGWLKDKYGLSWQIVPTNMDRLMKRPNAFAKMMQMKKLVLADF